MTDSTETQRDRERQTEAEAAAVRKQLQAVESELQHADERLARVLSTSSLPPLPGARALDSSTGSASSPDTSASGSAGDSPAAADADAVDGTPLVGSSVGWIFRCVITTKAGRCVVNCAPHGVLGAEGGGLAVGPLCRLLVTMHAFSEGGFLSYVQIHNRGVVLVDGGSYLVGIVCAAGVELPAVKLRAVQIRHVFGLLHQSQADEMQARHEADAEAMLKTYTIHSSRTEHSESAEPQTAPPFAHFEQLYLRPTLREPSLSKVWLQPLLQLPGVRHCFLVDVTSGSTLLSSSSQGATGADGDFGPFLRQCWGTLVEYARILCASEADAEDGAAQPQEPPEETAKLPASSSSSDSRFLGLIFDAGPLGLGGGLSASTTLALQAVSLGRERPACLVLVYLSAASAAEETRAAARSALAEATKSDRSGGAKRAGGFCSGGKGDTERQGERGRGATRGIEVRQLSAERERQTDKDRQTQSETDAENVGLALSGVAHARLQSEELDALPPRFSLYPSLPACVCVRARARARACVCVCLCVCVSSSLCASR
eukprot:COSAG03_NODE_1813_length_3479_cov_4.926036_1_plen_545_part_00